MIDPLTNKVRYVGKANDVAQRYKAHNNRARNHQIHKKNWIASLRSKGLKPVMAVIDVVPIDEWIYWETYWIAQMKAWGFDLINYTKGGDGVTFANQTSFKKGHGGRRVLGYNKDGYLVHDFPTCVDACAYLKIHKSGVHNCATGKRKTTKNCAWFFYEVAIQWDNTKLLDNIKDRFTKIRNPKSNTFIKGMPSKKAKKVDMYSKDGQLLKSFPSAKAAADHVGVGGSSVQWACLHNSNCKNFKFKYNAE